MNEQLPDKTVLIIILATIFLIFGLIFLTRPSQERLHPSIEWRDSAPTNSQFIKS